MGFTTPVTGALKRMGLKGAGAVVTIGSGRLSFAGEDGARAELPLEQIARARFGFVEGEGTSHTFIRLRLTDGRRLELYGRWGDVAGYYAVVWELAGALLARRSATVETGDGPYVPVLTVGVFPLGALACAIGTVWLWRKGEDWTAFLGALVVFLLLALFLGPWAVTRYWPRRIERQEDVLRALPGFKPPGRVVE